MRLARILVDPDRDDAALDAGILLICPYATIFRRDRGAIEDLSEHFIPTDLVESELTAIGGKTWPHEVSGQAAYNIASTFEAFVSAESTLILVDVLN
jgi:hypothetical protein